VKEVEEPKIQQNSQFYTTKRRKNTNDNLACNKVNNLHSILTSNLWNLASLLKLADLYPNPSKKINLPKILLHKAVLNLMVVATCQ
jgi:hypothetical protein